MNQQSSPISLIVTFLATAIVVLAFVTLASASDRTKVMCNQNETTNVNKTVCIFKHSL